MARIAGVDIPREKRLEISLTYIFGIGRTTAQKVCDATSIDSSTRVRDLTDHATQKQFIYRHIWRPHDFVIWDNRCTMHRARPFDDQAHRRELRRTTSLDLPLPASA